MKVEDVMTRDVVKVLPSTPLKEVARLLVAHRISGVPVVDRAGRVEGIVSVGDIVSKERGVEAPNGHALYWLFGPDEQDERKRHAAIACDAMTSPAVTIEPQRPVSDAARLMVERRVNRLPVVEHGTLVGIVTRTDLLRAFVRADEEIALEIREDVLLHVLWISPDSVDVRVAAGEVTIEGEVETRTDAELVAGYVARVPGVVSVDVSRLTWRQDDLARRGFRTVRRVG